LFFYKNINTRPGGLLQKGGGKEKAKKEGKAEKRQDKGRKKCNFFCEIYAFHQITEQKWNKVFLFL
jgi:hypothetical protein